MLEILKPGIYNVMFNVLSKMDLFPNLTKIECEKLAACQTLPVLSQKSNENGHRVVVRNTNQQSDYAAIAAMVAGWYIVLIFSQQRGEDVYD